jgi:hypothetical protein
VERLAVGGGTGVALLNRKRVEQQYQRKVSESLDACNKVSQTENDMIRKYIEAVRQADQALQQLCDAARGFINDDDDDDTAKQKLSLAARCYAQ